MTKIIIGELEVIDSGNVVSVDNKKVSLTLESQSPFTIEMQLVFIDDETETKFEGYEIEKVGIGLKFINFKNTLGTGNIKPIKIGWFNGRTLFINYRVFPINNNQGGIFHYTFLLGKKVNKHGKEIE